jgi:hypothetical protein
VGDRAARRSELAAAAVTDPRRISCRGTGATSRGRLGGAVAEGDRDALSADDALGADRECGAQIAAFRLESAPTSSTNRMPFAPVASAGCADCPGCRSARQSVAGSDRSTGREAIITRSRSPIEPGCRRQADPDTQSPPTYARGVGQSSPTRRKAGTP